MQDERQWQNMYIPHKKDNSCNEKMCASGERQGIYISMWIYSAMKKDIDMMVSGSMEGSILILQLYVSSTREENGDITQKM